MARTNSRKTKMTQRVVMRAHEEDVANLKIAAMQSGLDVSTFIRQVLVAQKIINPI